MNAIYPNPKYMKFQEWVDRVIQYSLDSTIPQVAQGELWTSWAERVRAIPEFSNSPIPLAISYPGANGWQIWAEEFIDYN